LESSQKHQDSVWLLAAPLQKQYLSLWKNNDWEGWKHQGGWLLSTCSSTMCMEFLKLMKRELSEG
jgi:hypothetical protein